MDFGFIARDSWGADKPLWTNDLHLPVANVFTELTRKDTCKSVDLCIVELRYLQRYNLQLQNCPDIRYNFLIGGDGVVYEGRGWRYIPRLPFKYQDLNRESLYIAFMGRTSDVPPDSKIFITYEKLIKFGIAKNYIHPKFLEFSLSPSPDLK